MNKGITIGIIVAVAAVLIYLLTRKGRVQVENGRSCIKVPSTIQRWQGDMKADWGVYGPAKKKYLGVDPESLQSEYIDGFFKAIDVQPNSKYVRKYAREIKQWLESGMADKHWNVELGELRCSGS